jgi:hypothetical protein
MDRGGQDRAGALPAHYARPALSGVVKIIETPKRDDPLRHDRRMLRRLRTYARGNTHATAGV